MNYSTDRMLSGILHSPGQFEVESCDVPNPQPGELLIRVFACAICGSDLRIMSNGSPRIKSPRIIGHEVAGEVVEVGKGVNSYTIGDKVSLGADIPCGECDFCRSGMSNCCQINYAIGYQFDGGFAEYMIVPSLMVRNGPIQKIPHSLPWAHAALAEPLACCLNGFERALFNKNTGGTVVIFGAGPIGMMLVSLAIIYGAEDVISIEPSFARRQRAMRLGANLALNPQNEDVVREVLTRTDGRGAQAVFTACSSVETHEPAIEIVARRGVVNLFGGLPKDARHIQFSSNHIHYREAYITGSHGSTPEHHATALELIASGSIDVPLLISHEFALSEMTTGIDLAKKGAPGKVVIYPSGSGN